MKTHLDVRNWNQVVRLLPNDWEKMGLDSGALRGLRKDKDPACLLRVLLIHAGTGKSLKDAAALASENGLANLSSVAIHKRLIKSGEWLRKLCCGLLDEREIDMDDISDEYPIDIVDSTIIKEPGPTGSQWRMQYGIRLPSMECTYFSVNSAKGENTGDSLKRFPVEPGRILMVDRGYSHAGGLHAVVRQGGYAIVRLNGNGTRLLRPDGSRFELETCLQEIPEIGAIGEWPVLVPFKSEAPIVARVCAIRNSDEAARLADRRLDKTASRNDRKVKDKTRLTNKYTIILTNAPAEGFGADRILTLYRIRWQIELAFKRLKSIVRLGHLPKRNDKSALAWIYGKMLVALLTERYLAMARVFSPWGYTLHIGNH